MKPKVTYKQGSFTKVRTGSKAEAELAKQANRIAADANESSGGGYVARVSKGKSRSRAAVIATNGKAIRDNAENNTLVRKMRGA
ncbi:hypothetical protein [Prescottella agglutinans]|uniref:Phage protein n=1 Tax=Prescottella agglutinans TaxID=1644129 RepID=A0ABT6M638_9NOCA|nr:hypothetical protein [Prescottella agglutinans]MDH6279344.1 hypothetical protein [Prescottella agglutinans]